MHSTVPTYTTQTKIAADEINENGGFNGYKVEILDAGDDQADPEKAVNAYNDLLDKGMQMLCGTVTSGSCIAVGAEAAEDTFLFTPSATAVDSITAGSNEFRMCFTDPAQGTKSAQYISEHKLATKVAVLYDSALTTTPVYMTHSLQQLLMTDLK